MSSMDVETFLKDFTEILHSPPADEKLNPKVVSKYDMCATDVPGHIVDWVLHYLENKNCPYELAVNVAKITANELTACISADNEQTLNTVALYNAAIAKLRPVCQSLVDAGHFSPCVTKPHLSAVFAIKNKRRKMEDRHVIHPDLNMLLDIKDMPSESFYAVYDGHKGVDAATFASAHYHRYMASHPAFGSDPLLAMRDAFRTLDENFLKICTNMNLKSGSTAVCALIRGSDLYLSWVGDSQAVLVRNGKPTFVSEPHKANREDEEQRIVGLGGFVTHDEVPRVNGVLAVTRAIGDPDFKHFVSSEAEEMHLQLSGEEDFLILACDGLYDSMTPEEIADFLYRRLARDKQGQQDTVIVAADLVHQAKLQGSEDNITAIIVFLRDLDRIKEFAAGIMPQKPSVLELSSSSTKKMKNAVNVMTNVAVAPEATELSELPTPPIEDVVASQQRLQMQLETLGDELSSMAIGHDVGNICQEIDSVSLKEGDGPDAKLSAEDEAMNVASSVVSSTIENAVKCISHGNTPEAIPALISPSQLNPFAQPFVMPSFVADDLDGDDDDIRVCDEHLTGERDIEAELDRQSADYNEKYSGASPFNAQVSGSPVENKSVSKEHDLVDLLQEESYRNGSKMDESKPNEVPNAVSNKEIEVNGQQHTPEYEAKKPESSIKDQLIEFGNESSAFTNSEGLSANTSADFGSQVFSPNEESSCIEKGILEASFSSDKQDIEDSTVPDLNLDTPTSVSKNEISKGMEYLTAHPADNLLDSRDILCPEVVQLDNSVPLGSNIPAIDEKDFVQSPEKISSPDLASLVLESLIKTEAETSGMAEHHADECHAETSALDLQKLPDGIPEADGVTEDGDSDSEKDGGWSYVKANDATEKRKSDKKASAKKETGSRVTTSDARSRAKSSTGTLADRNKKPVLEKRATDAKKEGTVKRSIPPAVKAAVDKPSRPASATLRVKKEDTIKPRTGISATAKPSTAATKSSSTTSIAAKANTAAAKTSRPMSRILPTSTTSTQNSRPTSSKPTSSSTSIGNTATRSASTAAVSKTTLRPASTTLSKVFPAQGTKASTALPANRGTTATRNTAANKVVVKLPNAATKVDGKPKIPPASTIRRAQVTTQKKPDVKETKDIVNKQISAQKSATSAANKNGVTKTAPIPSKAAPTRARVGAASSTKTAMATNKSMASTGASIKANSTKDTATSATRNRVTIAKVDTKKNLVTRSAMSPSTSKTPTKVTTLKTKTASKPGSSVKAKEAISGKIESENNVQKVSEQQQMVDKIENLATEPLLQLADNNVENLEGGHLEVISKSMVEEPLLQLEDNNAKNLGDGQLQHLEVMSKKMAAEPLLQLGDNVSPSSSEEEKFLHEMNNKEHKQQQQQSPDELPKENGHDESVVILDPVASDRPFETML